MQRRVFLLSTLATAGVSTLSRFAGAAEANVQSLRVLLGAGTAQMLDPTSFSFKGRVYRGSYSVLPNDQVVSLVPLEEYLYSVVAREMPRSWPRSALEAQAILARTYVLQRSNPNRAYDVVASQADQVYGGIEDETAQSSAAVTATGGQVLRYADDFAEVMYSSCCGGHTENVLDAWGGKNLPYLSGVACPYCTASPDFQWSRDVPLDAFTRAFQSELAGVGELSSVSVAGTDSSGRARAITVVGSTESIQIPGGTFRSRLGTRVVRSLMIRNIETVGSAGLPPAVQSMTIEGAGLGHGVGLCQWGARGMGLENRSTREILSFYFPNTAIGNA